MHFPEFGFFTALMKERTTASIIGIIYNDLPNLSIKRHDVCMLCAACDVFTFLLRVDIVGFHGSLNWTA